MNRWISLLIALRFSRTRKKSQLVSLISIVSTLGIMLGVAALIIGLSAMNGFQKELNDRVLSVIPHAQIYQQNQIQPNDWKALQQKLQHEKNIVSAVPFVSLTGLIEYGKNIQTAQVQGISLKHTQSTWRLPDFINKENWNAFSENPNNKIILGQGVAKKLQVKKGDWITLLIPSTNDAGNHLIRQPTRIRLQVAGILMLSGDIGYKLGLMSLEQAQKIAGMGNSVTGISVNVSDLFEVNSILSKVLDNVKIPIRVRSWTQDYGYMYQDIQLIRMILYIAMILVIGIACFNIVSTLVIAVKDKQSDIAILRTLGASQTLIRRIFIWYGLISGLIGCFAGIVIGSLISIYLPEIVQKVELLTHHQFLADDIYFVNFIPSELHITDVLIVALTAIILSLLASWYPARQACKVNPVEILNSK